MAIAVRRLLIAGRGGSFTVPVNQWMPIADILAFLDDGLVKDAGNPVLPKGTAGQWDDWGVRELGPVIDENGLIVTEGDGIWAYYWGRPDGTTGTLQIGLAKSTDDGYTWTRYGSNPLITPTGSGWYGSHIWQSSTVKLGDGTRVMIVQGRDGSNVDTLGCLTSSDGLTWSDEGVKLELSDFLDGATAITEFGVPSMIKRSSGDWLLLLEGLKSGLTNGWRVFGATASDPTDTWTPLNAGQPLLSPTGSGWEGRGVANAHVIEAEEGVYAIIYNGIASTSPNWQIGFAYSTDLTTWIRYASNPILSKGTAGQWDDRQTETCFFPKEPGRSALRIYYQGFAEPDGNHQIGLAETP